MISKAQAWEAQREILHREGKSGASEVPAVADLSPYTTPLKRYAIDSGVEVDVPSPEREELFLWGHLNQPTILSRYAVETGRTLQDFGDYTIQKNPLFGQWFVTLDSGVLACKGHDGPGVVEVKNVGHYMRGDWENGIPAYVEAQIQVQMAVTGCQWGSAAALIAGNHFVWGDVERDDKAIAWLYEQTVAHWERVKAGTPPAATAKDAAVLLALFPKHVPGKVVQVDEETALDFIGHTLWKARETAARNAAEAHRVHILEAAGDAEIVELPDGARFSVKEQKKKAYEVKASSTRVIRKMKETAS